MADTTIPAPIDPLKAALLGKLREAGIALGVLLAGHGVIGPNNTITPTNWEFIVGFVVALAPSIWGWVEKYRAAKTAKARETVAVMAGVNLVAQGAALATDGSLIASASSAPPQPVTPDAAKQIIQNFGPTTDQLNEMSLKAAKGA